MAIDKEGYVYVTGKTSSFGAGSSDMFLIKVSENGNIVWNITFGGQQADEGRGIVVDSQDNIYVTGSKYDNTSGDFDIFLTKYDKNGTIIWNREWGGSFRDKGYGIAIDQADYIYITGVTYIYETNEHRMVLIKYNGDGDVIWTVTWKGRYKEYEGMGYVFLDYGYDIAIDDDGFIYVVGTSYVSGADYQNRRLFVLKYDNRGNLLWELARKICFWDFGLGIAVDKQGTIYVVGASLSVQTVRVNVIMLGINNDGKLIWNLTWTNNVEATNLGLGVAVSQNNTVFITGYTGIYIDLPYYVELIMNGPTSAFVISFNNGDSDHDGLSYLWEKCVQTNPERNDTDGDGMPDGWEVNHGLKPTVNDATQDADGDGITNYEEYIRGTNPADTDSDEDFLPDNFDFIAGPLDSVIIFGVICVIVIVSAFTVNRYTTKRRK